MNNTQSRNTRVAGVCLDSVFMLPCCTDNEIASCGYIRSTVCIRGKLPVSICTDYLGYNRSSPRIYSSVVMLQHIARDTSLEVVLTAADMAAHLRSLLTHRYIIDFGKQDSKRMPGLLVIRRIFKRVSIPTTIQRRIVSW